MVSVIVPVYGVEPYLKRCVDSILSQTFTDFELILVDDGSPDNCGLICDEYAQKDSRVKVIHKENGGVSRARNTALEIATGEYIAFCDSDDSWEPQLLEKVVSAFTESKADLVSFQYRYFGMNGLYKESDFPVESRVFNGWDEKLQYFSTSFLNYKLGFEVCSQAFRRNIIAKNQIQFCETCHNFAEDMGFVGKYLLCSDSFVVLSDRLYNIHARETSMMARSKLIVRFDEMNEVSMDLSSFAEQMIPRDFFKKWYGIIHFFIMYNQYQKLIYTEKYRTFPAELAKIKHQKEFGENTWNTIKCKSELVRLFGKHNAARIIILSRFCLHQNWYLYVLDRRIFYFFNKVRGDKEEK